MALVGWLGVALSCGLAWDAQTLCWQPCCVRRICKVLTYSTQQSVAEAATKLEGALCSRLLPCTLRPPRPGLLFCFPTQVPMDYQPAPAAAAAAAPAAGTAVAAGADAEEGAAAAALHVALHTTAGSEYLSITAEVPRGASDWATPAATAAALSAALAAAGGALGAAGLSWRSALFVHLYVPSMAHFAAANAAYAAFFPPVNPPARATVEIGPNPDLALVVEILCARWARPSSCLLFTKPLFQALEARPAGGEKDAGCPVPPAKHSTAQRSTAGLPPLISQLWLAAVGMAGRTPCPACPPRRVLPCARSARRRRPEGRRVLHVQSISEWAPSCIGPYAQVGGCAAQQEFPAPGLSTSSPRVALAPQRPAPKPPLQLPYLTAPNFHCSCPASPSGCTAPSEPSAAAAALRLSQLLASLLRRRRSAMAAWCSWLARFPWIPRQWPWWRGALTPSARGRSAAARLAGLAGV